MNGTLLEKATMKQLVARMNDIIDTQKPEVKEVLEQLAKEHETTVEDIMGNRAKHRKTRYRAVYRLRQQMMTWAEIAEALGYNDHSSAVYAFKQGAILEAETTESNG